jgi:hypothetical protein
VSISVRGSRLAPGSRLASTAVVRVLPALVAALLLGALAGCGGSGSAVGADQTAAPTTHTCRNLKADDITDPSNDSPSVSCADPHNAETYAVGTLPTSFRTVSYNDPGMADWAYATCESALEEHLGADDSLLLRSILTWVWYRPTEAAWDAGARWYRCDVVGGQAPSYVDLPITTKNLLRSQPPDPQWMVCAKGASFNGTKVPCSQPHEWRAVATIKVPGDPGAPYPGDASVRKTSDRSCQEWVNADLGFPKSFDYGYTWFGEDQWNAGNRRSVCWAKTTD